MEVVYKAEDGTVFDDVVLCVVHETLSSERCRDLAADIPLPSRDDRDNPVIYQEDVVRWLYENRDAVEQVISAVAAEVRTRSKKCSVPAPNAIFISRTGGQYDAK